MAQPKHTTQRRNLAPPPLPEPKISMDPTNKKHPKSNLSTTSTIKPHSTTPPDPTVPPHPSTIQNISSHFVKLYANHKILASLKGSNGLSNSHSRCQHHPQTIDKHLQAKGIANSTVLDTSCIALTKSSSQHGRRNVADVHKESTRIKVKEKDKKSITNKKPHQREELDVEKELARQKFEQVVKKSSSLNEGFNRQGKDVKKAAALMAKSVESDELKRFNEGCEIKRPSISLAINGGGRRKSFCCSQTELADFFSCTGVKVVAVDMPPFMQIHAVDCARKAHDSLEKFTSKTLALTLKKGV